MVTAETALALPALVVVLAGLVTVILAVSAQLRCVAAAREGARAAARGEDAATVQQLALRVAPDRASVTVTGGGDTVTVTVSAQLRPLGLSVGEIAISGSATAQREPTTDESPAAAALASLVGCLRLTRPRTRCRGAKDRGSGTLYVAAVISILSALAAGAVILGKAHVAHGRAAAAADLAALAAAQVLLDGSGDPCARADAIAARNRARVDSCVIEGETVVVSASVPVELGSLGVLTASARARAGPVT